MSGLFSKQNGTVGWSPSSAAIAPHLGGPCPSPAISASQGPYVQPNSALARLLKEKLGNPVCLGLVFFLNCVLRSTWIL